MKTVLSRTARCTAFLILSFLSAGLATAQFADDTGTGSTTITDTIAITLAANTAPTAGQATIGTVGVTGFGVPSGTITLANVTVTLQPAPGSAGPVANIPPISIVTLVGTTRRFTFKIPAALAPATPQTYLVSVAGTTDGGTAFASSNTSTLIINPPASIGINPGSGNDGSAVGVTITGQYTHFLQAGTSINAGAGIIVSGIVVSSPTALTAQFTIDPAAATGPRTVTVTTGAEVASTSFGVAQAPTPALSITKIHTGNFTQGQQNATYTVTVSNAAGGAATNGTVTVTDTPSSGLTLASLSGNGWVCNGNACTRSDALAAGSAYPPITAAVNVAANAASAQSNAASVSGGGSASANATDLTTVKPVPDLTITKTHTGSFAQGQQNATYTITVSNAPGAGTATSTITVTDTPSSGLTLVSMSGSDWACNGNVCTRTGILPGGSSFAPITATVNVAANATSPQLNSVTVSGGGELNTSNDTAMDSTTIGAGQDLVITKTHTGNFTQGQQNAGYTITVSNSGQTATSGTVTVTDTIPTGESLVSMSGTGWNCNGNICTRSDALGGGSSYPAIAVAVNVAANAPSSVINSATVSGGGDVNTNNNTANNPTTIIQVADLTISKTHTGNFSQGQQGANFTVTVSNAGPGPTNGTVTVTDTLPSGLSLVSMAGTGWACPGTTCTRSDVLAANGSYPPIVATVNVLANATSPQVNSAAVSGGGELNTANDTATDSVTIGSGTDLTISKTHIGNFTQGQQNAGYTITVTNVGVGPTNGSVTVTDTVPSGEALVSLSGTGWSCNGNTCSRSDTLNGNASYPAITATVNVANNATSPQVNSANVAGGGDVNPNNNTANDSTVINQVADLTISKTHTGNFSQGQQGANFTVTVSNAGPGATNGTVTVTDTLPSGLSLVSMAGTGWACPGTTCTRSDVLAANGSYPPITVTVNVATNATSPQLNSVTVSGGGELNTSNDTAMDSTTIGAGQDLTITKTHTGNFTQGQQNAAYTITVTNNGQTATSGTVTVTDTAPTGESLVSLLGTGWNCNGNTCTRSDALNGNASYPAITATVNVANNATSPQVNSATVSGGGDVNPNNNAANDSTVINQVADLTIGKTHTGNFSQGQQGANFTVTVSNAGPGATNGTVTVTDTLPSGLSLVSMAGTGWSCPGTTCTRSDVLAANGSYPPITVTVNVATNATSPQVNSATVSGGGELNTANDTATDSVTIGSGTDLTITKTHTGNFTQGQQNAGYTITVTNNGQTATSGTVTVTDTAPTGESLVSLLGTGWNCNGNTCTRSDALNGNASYPAITATVNVANNATSPQVNSATVSGGGDVNPNNNTANDSTVINQVADLTITKTHTGNFSQGQQGANFTVTVSNASPGATNGAVTVTDTLPSGLSLVSMAGTGWSCPGTTCTRSDVLAANGSYPPITVTVNVATNATSPQVNSAAVSGGGELNTANDTATDSVTIGSGTDLTISKTHTGNFTQGQQNAGYTITVTNNGQTATSGTVTVTDTAPTGESLVSLSGTGWSCNGSTCTRSDALNGNASYPAITATVNVANNATSPQVNSANVAGGGDVNPNNNTANDSTVINQVADLTITKTHTGNFSQGQQNAAYTVTVSNAGPGATNGAVTVTDTLPSGLSLVSMAGTGWSCPGTTCTRSDVLAANGSYPPITVTVNVATNATSPQVNSAAVSGGGELNTANDTATDSVTIGSGTDLTISKTHTGNFTQGQQNAGYTITVTNNGQTATSGTVTVTDTAPTGESLVSLSGTGWSCNGNTCTRSDALNGNASYPAITATVNVANNATSPQVNSANVAGGGDVNPNNNTANDSTVINSIPVVLTLNPNNGRQGQTLNSVVLTGGNTHFTNSSVVAFSNTGVTASNVSATDATHLSMTLTITGNAATGLSDVSVTTGAEVANGTGVFTVQTGALTITPNAGTPQHATVNSPYSVNLQVLVKDAASNPVNNAQVTFTIVTGSGGAGGNFVSSNVVNTNASGLASAPQLNANTVSGTFTVTAAVTGAPTPATFNLTNDPGAANILSIVSGSGQTATVATDYTNPLVVMVTDSFHNPTPGVNVTFTAPSTGASITFASSSTVATDNNGRASSPVMTANHTAGTVIVSTTSGSLTAVNFNLTNLPGTAVSITALAISTPQNTQTNTPFPQTLQAQVSDQFGNGVPNISVTYTAPSSGPSGQFSNSTTSIILNTGTNGVTSVSFTANGIAGSFNVIATAASIATPATFVLTNNGPQITNLNPNSATQGQSLTVIITGNNQTSFTQGATVANFGIGINAGVVTVNGPSLASVPINVGVNAPTGPRTITVTTGSQVVQATFTVIAGTAVIQTLSPNAGAPNSNVTVTIVAAFTHFDSNTTANFGPGIQVGGNLTAGVPGPIQVSDATHATASLVITAGAATGPRDPVFNTPDAPGGAETLTVVGGFNVTSNPGTAPTILQGNPVSGATGVPLDAQITLQTSRPIDRNTVTTADFILVDDTTGQNVPATVSVDVTGRVLTLVPSQLLAVSRTFTIEALNSIADTFGNKLSNFFSSFTTGFTTDVTGPALVDISPRNADASVPLNAPIVISFNKGINQVTQPAGIQVTTGGSPISGAFSFSNGNAKVTFTPAPALAASTVYTVTLTSALTDAAGNALTNPQSISFTTGTATDATGGTITSTSPINSQTGVGTNAIVRVAFSKMADPISIVANTNFRLFVSNTSQFVQCMSTVAPDRRSATLTPNAPLLPNTTYTFQIFNWTDIAGNLGGPTTISFTTGSNSVTTPGTATLTGPPPGSTGVPQNAKVSVTVNRPLDPTSINNNSIVLSPAVTGVVTLSADQMTVNFAPSTNLAANTLYTVTTGALVDGQGIGVTPLTTNNTFTTGTGTLTTPGTVALTTPSTLSNVPVTTAVVLTFSRPVNPTTVNANTVRLFDNTFGTQAVNIAVNGAVVTLTPVSQLRANASIAVQSSFSSLVLDLAGNAFPFAGFSFTTANTVDNTPPAVSSITPSNGTTGLGQNTQVVITFTKSLAPGTVNTNSFTLFNGAVQLGTSVSISSDNRTVTLTPGALAGSTTFTVVVTTAVTDPSGNHLAQSFASNFTTAATPVAGSLQVQTQIPANGAVQVPVNSPVTLYTNKPVDPTTINSNSFLVSQNGILVAGSIQVLGNGQTLQFTPSGTFTNGALVQVFLTTAATDVFGFALSGNYTGQFTVVPDLSTTNPTVVATNPTSGAANVQLNQIVEIRFSKQMDGTAANLAQVKLLLNNNSATPVTTTNTLIAVGTVIKLVPSAALAASSTYCISIASGTLKDVNGLTLTGFVTCFNTGTTSNTLPPSVTAVAPPDGTTGIGVNALLRITFSKAVNPITVNSSTVQLSGGSFSLMPASISTSDNISFTIAPQASLPANTQMTFTINGVEDLTGNVMTVAHTTTFTTSSGPDFSQATVLSQSPTSGATNVPVNTTFVVQYSKPIDPRTVTANNFRLIDGVTGVFVPGTMSSSSDLTTWTFLPSSNLAVGRAYTAQALSFQDLAGNTATNGSSSFTMAFATNSVGPTLVFTSPGNNATGVPINAVVQISFNEPVDGSTVNQVQLTENGSNMNITRTLSNGNQTLTLVPNALFAQNAPHTIVITGVRDTSGNLQSAIAPQTFTTTTGIDVVGGGTITSTNPVSGQTGVGTNPVLRATFSKIFNPISIVGNFNFRLLQQATGQIIKGTLTFAADRLSATLVPNTPLLPNTNYNFQVTSWTDFAGNPGGNVSLLFTTGSTPVSSPATFTLVSPSPGSASVPQNASVIVVASHALDPTSVNNSSIVLSPAAAGAVTLAGDQVTLTFTPSGTLAANTPYTVTTGPLADSEGNAATPLTSNNTFTTGTGTVTTPGTVTMTTPTNGATSVPVTTNIVLTYSRPVNAATVNANTVRVFDQGLGVVAANIAVSGAVVTLTPLAQLRANASILVQSSFSGQVFDQAGNAFPFLQDSFTTANTADTTPPTVSSVTPNNGTTGLGQNTQVVITFSESVLPSSVTANTITLFTGATQFGGSPQLSSDNRTVTINPGQLPAGTTFTVIVTTGVADFSGNHLAAQFSSTFTTATAGNGSSSSVQSQIPANGATGVPVNSTVTLYMNKPVNPSTVTSNSFLVSQNGNLVIGSVQALGNGQALQFTPTSPFANGALVQVFLTTAVTDAFGFPLTGNYTGQFTVVPDPTTTNPAVVATNPTSGTGNVPLNQIVEVSFNKQMDGSAANLAQVKLLLNNNSATPVTTTNTLVGGGMVIKLVPSAPLAASSNVCLSITSGTLKDANGLTVNGFVICFNTGTTSNTLPPAVTAVAPPNATTGIGVNALLRITFSKAVNPITVNSSTVQLSGGSFTLMPTSISTTDNINFTIAPQASLPPNTQMTFTINGAEDTTGNAMTAANTTTFTTSNGPDFTGPVVVSVSPLNGSVNVPENAVIIFQVNKPIDPRTVKADPATLNSDNLIITDNTVGGRLPGTFSISSDLTVLTFLPNATLPAGHNFTAQFFTYQDLTGNPGSGGSTNFTTSSATDSTPPTVVTTNPLTGLTNVPTNAVLHILFNKPVQPTSLGQVQVLESGSPMVITTALTNGNQTLTLMPNALFTPNAAHSMTITGVKDMSGNVIVGTVTINFTTGGGIILNPSIPAPAFSPTNNSTGQSVNVQPTVTYSVPIDPVVAFTGSVRMRTTTTLVLVPTTFSISADSKTLTIIPSAPLANATQYTIFSNFGSTVVDQAGNSVTSGQSIFTTQ